MKDIIGGVAVIFAGSILLAASAVGLAGCAKQSNPSTNIKDQSIVELTVPYGETSFYINTHYIIKIESYTYYDYHIELIGDKECQKWEKDKPYEGSIIYLNGYEKAITAKESPEKILELIGE